MPDYIEKYDIKMKGLRLEKENPYEAIKFYKELLNHRYFINDYFLYRRLVLLYNKTKQYEKIINTIRCFFKSGIYCNRYNYLWFRNKLRRYIKKGLISSQEIDELTDYFKNHGCLNIEKSNTPLPIADRIIKKRGEIIIDPEYRYNRRQKAYELEEEARELKRQGKIQECIQLYNYMIDEMGYKSYRYFMDLCIAYRQINDIENESRIIDNYFLGKSTRTKVSDEWFEKRLEDLLDILEYHDKNNKKSFDKLFHDDKFIDEISENAKLHDEINSLKKQIKSYEENFSNFKALNQDIIIIKDRLKKLEFENIQLKNQIDSLKLNLNRNFDIKDNKSDSIIESKNEYKIQKDTAQIDSKFETHINEDIMHIELDENNTQINSEFEIEIDLEFLEKISSDQIYEYDETLPIRENLLRKVLLKEHGRFLAKEKHYKDAIKFYNELKKNTYFKNDWYPYRQITMIYEKVVNHEAVIENIKELLSSEIYLNGYQFVWFTNKLRISIDLLKYQNKADDSLDEEIQKCIEFYEKNLSKYKSNLNKYLADRFIKKPDKITLISNDEFNFRQKSYEIEQIGRIYESVGNYELAVNHYINIINSDFKTNYKIYQRLCFCFEKLSDYSNELKVIKLYYTNPPVNVTEYSDNWFENRLDKVNSKLGTNYKTSDLMN